MDRRFAFTTASLAVLTVLLLFHSDLYPYAPIIGGGDGTPIHLIRAPTSGLETQGNWEYFSGTPSNPSWSKDVQDRAAVFEDPGGTALARSATITYIPPVDQYVLIWHPEGGNYAAWEMYVSDNPYGSWTKVASYTDWCGDSGESEGPLHKHLAPKWIGEISNGELEFWLVWSGSGQDPADAFNLRKGIFNVQ